MVFDCPSCHTANRVPAARLTSRANCGRCKTPLSPSDRPLAIASEADFDELVRESPLPVLVDFWAEWCGPCHAVAPEVASLAKAQAGKAVVAKVDTEALSSVASRFAIRSIPTMILFREGREAKRLSGAMPAQAIANGVGL